MKSISVYHNQTNVILFKHGKKGKVEINIFVNYLTFSLKMKDNQEMKEAVVCWIFTLLIKQSYLYSFTSREFWKK